MGIGASAQAAFLPRDVRRVRYERELELDSATLIASPF